jgi:pimeloyl-ACP methyl ester carboxylesterase
MEHTSNPTTAQPRVLLLHGAGLGRWIWEDVVPHLGDVIGEPLDLPGRGPGGNPDEVTLQDCVNYVRTELDRSSAATVLVGHSFSAEVALAAAAAAPASVAAVVFVSGVFPESGKPFTSVLPLPQRLVVRFFLARARGGIKLPPSGVRKEYCNDLDEPATALVLSRIVPEVPRLYLDPVHWSG